jgi:hypothetical protein
LVCTIRVQTQVQHFTAKSIPVYEISVRIRIQSGVHDTSPNTGTKFYSLICTGMLNQCSNPDSIRSVDPNRIRHC